MSSSSIGVAVIGAGMAGRSHLAGYRAATAVHGSGLPEVRFVAVGDVNATVAKEAANRFGYERAETSWQAIAEAPDIDVVSVVVANTLHREIVEGLLAGGKHVLCEKPLAPSVEDAEAMVAAASKADRQAATGFTFRRSPAINAIRTQLQSGSIGKPVHLDGHYWCDYGCDPMGPMSWRYKGGPGSGALADIGAHLVDLAEFLCGPIVSVSGAVLATYIKERHLPVGAVVGHALAEVSAETEPVENEDLVSFTAQFASGATATLSASRTAYGHPNGLGFEVFAEQGAATFDLARASEFGFVDGAAPHATHGYRQVLVGPEHPYITGGLPMDFPGVGHGQNDLFAWQARAFLDQAAGIGKLAPLPSLADGLHNMEIQAAVTQSALSAGQAVTLA